MRSDRRARRRVAEGVLGGLCVLALVGCASTRSYVAPGQRGWSTLPPPPDSLLRDQVFLVGDVGEPSTAPVDPVLALLAHHLADAPARTTVVYLGDNVYPKGLIDTLSARRSEAEQRLQEEIDAARIDTLQPPGVRVLFIPGNHDWNYRHTEGALAVQREEAFVDQRVNERRAFLPAGGYPGPVEVDLGEHLTLVALDTEWWLYHGPKPYGTGAGYDLEDPLDVMTRLDDVVRRHRKDDVLVVGHHAVYSNGPHGGHLPLRTHLFPLTALWKRAYLPLPGLGSLYVLYRQYAGGRQDISNPVYGQLRNGLTAVFSQHEGLIYAAAHDHSLQYFREGQQHYVVSGAGSKTSYAAPGDGAVFTASRLGFAVLRYYRDGQVWLSFWEPQAGAASGHLLFRTQLRAAEPRPAVVASDDVPAPDYRNATVDVAAGPEYAASPLKERFAGKEHRLAWTTPVVVPVLDLGHAAGGLVPLRQGGGKQTLSLHLQGADGREYVLRSVDKYPLRSVPQELYGTFAADFVKDQVASLFPYSPLVATPLAEAAGLLHTRPRLVYVPDDPRLGPYRDLVAGQLMLFDVHPGDDVAGMLGLGAAKEAVGADNLYRHLRADNDDRVDQAAFARARLLDLLISDWDRGTAQWRWAAYDDPDGKGTLYRPIPLDRDWAFNRMDGLFPSLAPYVLHRYQGFGRHYGSLRRLTTNGLGQDRRLTNALTRRDWIRIADSLRAALTDDAIDRAVRNLPPPIYARYGTRFTRLLKVRRDKLPDVAEDFYELDNKVVDVVGSDKHEHFEVRRFTDSTQVAVYKTTKDGALEQVIYRRTFFPRETREIRLYGLDGRDQFVVTGDARHGLRVIGVGGPGDDTFIDRSTGTRGKRKTWFYDDPGPGNTWETGGRTRVVRSLDPVLNAYSGSLYARDGTYPQFFFGSNKDDGFFLGGGALFIRQGFHKQPFARSHRIVGNAAAKTGAFNVRYQGRFVGLAGAWDGVIDAEVHTPNSIRNFYGFGNETTPASFFRARLRQARLAPGLSRPLPGEAFVQITPVLQYTRVRAVPGDPSAPPGGPLPADAFDDQVLAGLDGRVRLEDVDDAVVPTHGFRLTGSAGVFQSVSGADHRYGTVHADATFYLPLVSMPSTALALRIGGGHTVGDFPFYAAQTLGGTTNLRGYRSDRFSGASSLYQNLDLRLRLFRFATYLATGEAGLLGFLDNGRVWTEGDPSRRWHQGYGGGLWLRLFDRVLIVGSAGRSAEDRTFTLGLDFSY